MNIFEIGLSATSKNVSGDLHVSDEYITIDNSSDTLYSIVSEYQITAELNIERNMTKGSSTSSVRVSAIGYFPETPTTVRILC